MMPTATATTTTTETIIHNGNSTDIDGVPLVPLVIMFFVCICTFNFLLFSKRRPWLERPHWMEQPHWFEDEAEYEPAGF